MSVFGTYSFKKHLPLFVICVIIKNEFLRAKGDFMRLETGMRVKMKKKHPCSGDVFFVTRTGMDVKLRCEKCGREVMMPRAAAERAVKKILEENKE